MKLVNSVCSTLMFPETRRNIGEFARVASFLKGRGAQCMEFYYDGPEGDRFGDILADNGLDGVYIAVLPSKEQKLWLCDLVESGRQAALKLFKRCIDHAHENGLDQVMINSGALGGDPEKQMDALADSIEELFGYARAKNWPLRLLMEPCDDNMQAYHLLGSWQRTREFTKRVNDAGLPMELTMDCAHSSEVGEDFVDAVRATKSWCRHVHFANCNITDKDSPLYGDKHVGFEYQNTEWTPETLAELFARLGEIYPGDEELRIGIEILCREGDPFAYYDKTWAMLPFLHKENQK